LEKTGRGKKGKGEKRREWEAPYSLSRYSQTGNKRRPIFIHFVKTSIMNYNVEYQCASRHFCSAHAEFDRPVTSLTIIWSGKPLATRQALLLFNVSVADGPASARRPEIEIFRWI